MAGDSYVAGSIKDAESVGNAMTAFVRNYGGALQPRTVAMIQGITNHLVFLDTLGRDELQKELDSIEGLTNSLWYDIRGPRGEL